MLDELYTWGTVTPGGDCIDFGWNQDLPPTGNAFCPTGPGGGVDPTCSPNLPKVLTSLTRGTFDHFQSASDKGEFLKKHLTEFAKELGIKIEPRVLSDGEFNTFIAEDAKRMGVNPMSVKAAAKQVSGILAFRKSSLTGITSKAEFSKFMHTAYHEVGHAFDRQVMRAAVVKHTNVHDYQDSKSEAYAEAFGSRVSLIVKGQGITAEKAAAEKWAKAAYKAATSHHGNYLLETSSLIQNAFCPTGPGGGVDASCSPGGAHEVQLHELLPQSLFKSALNSARRIKADFLAKLDKVTDVPVLRQLKAGANKAKEIQKRLTDGMKERYGPVATYAILASSQAIGWSAIGIGVAATGTPVVLPGASLWGALPGVAIAEGLLQTARGFRTARKLLTGNLEGIVFEQVDGLARHFLADFKREWQEHTERTYGSPAANSNPNHDELGRFAVSLEMPHGLHTPEGAKKLVDHLKKETGLDFKVHGSVGKGATSKNDVDLVYIAPKEEDEEKHHLETMRAEKEVQESYNRGEITKDQMMERLYGDPGNLVDSAMSRAGFKPVKQMEWPGFTVVRYKNEHSNHTVELWGPNDSTRTRSIDLTANRSWAASSSQEKLNGFQEWLKTQLGELATGKTQEQLWDAYIKSGWRKGVSRSFDDTNRARPRFTPEEQIFYAGSRDEFLRTSFNQPVAKEKVELLAARTFDEMENVTDDMANRMSRALADGMVEGLSPHDVAKDLMDVADFSRQRAEVVARTELIRAHAEGQLTALEQLGVDEVGVEVEWLATEDEKTCPLCSDLEGTVLTIEEARGMLPRHPNCRCCWVPNVDNTEEE